MSPLFGREVSNWGGGAYSVGWRVVSHIHTSPLLFSALTVCVRVCVCEYMLCRVSLAWAVVVSLDQTDTLACRHTFRSFIPPFNRGSRRHSQPHGRTYNTHIHIHIIYSRRRRIMMAPRHRQIGASFRHTNCGLDTHKFETVRQIYATMTAL